MQRNYIVADCHDIVAIITIMRTNWAKNLNIKMTHKYAEQEYDGKEYFHYTMGK